MSDEPDYSSLSLDERLVHKVWKVRLESYGELIKEFDNSRNPDDECFQRFNSLLDLCKKIVTDLNVVAQEQGIQLLAKYLELGASVSQVNKLKNGGVIAALCEKGLSSSRAGTKTKSIECLLLFVEISNQPNTVVEEIIPFCSHRLPKLVAGCVSLLAQIIENFGCSVIQPKPIIDILPKLFAHADRNVRNETTKLAVEIYKWMKDALKSMLFDDLKPVQQKDLTKAFDAISGETPHQNRLTRSQQEQQRQQQQSQQSQDDGVNDQMDMDDEGPGELEQQIDPFDLMEPVEILSKLPNDFSVRVNSSSWKDRKAVLEEVCQELLKVVKLTPKDDYLDVMRIFGKCMKDANIQVVQLAANCVEFVAKGLKKDFRKYQPVILVPILERNKEKKASVAEALSNALDAIFISSSLSEVLEGTISAMSHKTPQVRISATNYLQRCLAQTTTPPTSGEIDSIMGIGVKLLSESQEPVRQASAEMIGTLMKITGERELRRFLEKVDENRKTKIYNFHESVEVKSSGSSGNSKPVANANTIKPKQPSLGPTKLGPSKNTPSNNPSTTIPSKRMATSPAKRPDQSQKVSSYGRSLTGRSLAAPSTTTKLSHPSNSTMTNSKTDMEIDHVDLSELKALREENQKWKDENNKLITMDESLKGENYRLTNEINELRTSFDKLNKDHSNSLLMIKQKDTQIQRSVNDVENAKLKIRDLEQTIEMMKLQQKSSQNPESTTKSLSPFEQFAHPNDDDTVTKKRITSGELSSRVDRLSIDGESKENANAHEGYTSKYTSPEKRYDGLRSFSGNSNSTPFDSTTVNTNTTNTTTTNTNTNNTTTSDFDNSEDGWKKAAEVTNQLKARIERMKARTRMPSMNQP